MKKLSARLSFGLPILLATAFAVFYGLKTRQLEAYIEKAEALKRQTEAQSAVQKELSGIDSVLLKGAYEEALRAYEAKSQRMAITDGASIEMRVALVKELLRLQHQNKVASIESRNAIDEDSSQVQTLPPSANDLKTDSLRFALEKAQVQIQSLKKQLANKAFGEYLTFTNSKGSQMHYVGQVKNGKANGYGVALFNTGSRYVGVWKDNQRHGKGTFYWSDGEYYEGSFHQDKRSGEGTYYWPNGERYAGHWEDDKRSGQGTFYSNDGKVLADGIWVDDKLAVLETDRSSMVGRN